MHAYNPCMPKSWFTQDLQRIRIVTPEVPKSCGARVMSTMWGGRSSFERVEEEIEFQLLVAPTSFSSVVSQSIFHHPHTHTSSEATRRCFAAPGFRAPRSPHRRREEWDGGWRAMLRRLQFSLRRCFRGSSGNRRCRFHLQATTTNLYFKKEKNFVISFIVPSLNSRSHHLISHTKIGTVYTSKKNFIYPPLDSMSHTHQCSRTESIVVAILVPIVPPLDRSPLTCVFWMLFLSTLTSHREMNRHAISVRWWLWR
jgi:hypothetical protein